MQDLEMGTSVVNEEFVVAVGSNVNVVAFVNEVQQTLSPPPEAPEQVRRYIIICTG